MTCRVLQNALAYFDTAVSYVCKMLMILTPAVFVHGKPFQLSLMFESKTLEGAPKG
jgi:hypothetical protein